MEVSMLVRLIKAAVSVGAIALFAACAGADPGQEELGKEAKDSADTQQEPIGEASQALTPQPPCSCGNGWYCTCTKPGCWSKYYFRDKFSGSCEVDLQNSTECVHGCTIKPCGQADV